MAKNPKWTKQEDYILYSNYSILGVKGCKNLLSNRTEKSINIRASRLGLKLEKAWNKKLTTQEYILKLSKLKIKYYPIEEYVKDSVEILHECPKCLNSWKVKPNNILSGSGCPKCNKGFGWTINKGSNNVYAYLYLFKIKTTKDYFLKLGITNNLIKRKSSIKNGINKDFINLEEIAYIKDSSDRIYNLEKELLAIYNNVRGVSHTYFAGHTETLPIDLEGELVSIFMDYLIEEID